MIAAAPSTTVVAKWLDAVEMAKKREERWRERAREVVNLYRGEDGAAGKGKLSFNVLYSNTETMAAAIYNSTPIPDVRPRFANREDKIATQLAQVLERALSAGADIYDLDGTMRRVVMDALLPGRGVPRVRYSIRPTEDPSYFVQSVTCEPVRWDRLVIGPADTWQDVPFLAFELSLSRQEILELCDGDAAKVGRVSFDAVADEAKNKYDGEKDVPDEYRRARVWEIWDRQTRSVVFVSKGLDEPIREERDPLGLEGFFPIPRPVYAIETTGSLVPVEFYRQYEAQAKELDEVSRRIQSLAKAIRWRGVRAANVPELDRLEDVEDGTFVPAEGIDAFMATGGDLSKAFWTMPIVDAVAALRELVQHRESIKQTIYEITGISDILRGSTQASETATAQNIKTQWASLRIQRLQGEVQRMARDLFRMKVELIANHFDATNLGLLSGVEVAPEMEQLLRQDVMRSYRIDIETDSTIRGDIARQQEQMSQFLQGTAQYMQAVGPAVMQGYMPADAAVTIYAAFARQFKLGKQAEDTLDDLVAKAQAAAQQPPQPPPPDPKVELEKAKLAADQQTTQMQAQLEMEKAGADVQIRMAELELEREKLAIERERLVIEREKLGAQTAQALVSQDLAARELEQRGIQFADKLASDERARAPAQTAA